MILEACCGSPESLIAAVEGGAQRVELCSALELDGLTPPWEWLSNARRLYPTLSIYVLIRPRAGDFCYTSDEVSLICSQVEQALDLGADGVVVGCLTPAGDVDMPAMEAIMETVRSWTLARDLVGDRCHASNDFHFFPATRPDPSVTFHRAFDVCRKPLKALEDIIALGCDRILTSGQAPTAPEGIPLLRKLIRAARGRITIMPGCGLTPDNIVQVAVETGATELHGSFHGGTLVSAALAALSAAFPD